MDDETTKIEVLLSRILHSIRSAPTDSSVNSCDAASIVAHLASRTAQIRNSFKYGFSQLLEHEKVQFANVDNLQAFAGLDQPIPNDRFRKHILRGLLERPEITGSKLPTHVIERFVFYYCKKNASEFLAKGLPSIPHTVDCLLAEVGNLVRDGHNKALAEALTSTSTREAFLGTLDWTIQIVLGPAAILSDCIVIAITDKGEVAPLMLLGQDDIRAVLLPVSPKKLLVGITDGYTVPLTFDYNLEAARSSHSFFLSSCDDAETARLHPAIASVSMAILDEAVENGIQDLLSNRLPSQSELDAEQPQPSIGTTDPADCEFQFQASFVGIGDQEAIQAIMAQLRIIVSEFSKVLPLKRLDGITIASDYPAALRDLNRGFENAPPAETASKKVGVGIAQVVTVMRFGEVKGHMVIASDTAHALLSDDAAHSKFGIYVVVRGLALVAMIECIEASLPGTMLRSAGGEFDSWLYAQMDAALNAYVASCITAGLDDKQELFEAKCQLLKDSINRMTDTVIKERLAYRYHGDLEKLLRVTLPLICHVLTFAADLLGHCEFAGSPSPEASDELQTSLEQAGLKNWLEMYRVDLERFYRRLGRWTSFDEFLAFNIHVERLFWQFGMFPWEASEGIRSKFL